MLESPHETLDVCKICGGVETEGEVITHISTADLQVEAIKGGDLKKKKNDLSSSLAMW